MRIEGRRRWSHRPLVADVASTDPVITDGASAGDASEDTDMADGAMAACIATDQAEGLEGSRWWGALQRAPLEEGPPEGPRPAMPPSPLLSRYFSSLARMCLP